MPPWPLPKIFRLTKGGKLNEGIFKGSTINTPSMLCVADYLDALEWIRRIGGLEAAIRRSERNLAVVDRFVKQHNWIHFLARDESQRSSTSVCLTLDLEDEKVKSMVQLLAAEAVAYDIGAYRDAPAGLRIWCGATVEESDLEKLMPWLLWAHEQVSGE
jgi:phosphoserine aminotransferase